MPGVKSMKQLSFPARKEYIRQKKNNLAIHPLGVFPALYPKELLWSYNILPVEIWDPPLQISGADAHLQPYICPIVKSGLELILQGHCQLLDGFLFPHTCDSIQNLASIVNHYLGITKRCFFFYLPKNSNPSATKDFYCFQLQKLQQDLEKEFGANDPLTIKKMIVLGDKISTQVQKLYLRRTQRDSLLSNRNFYQLLRMGEYLLPQDFLSVLTDAILQDKKGEKKPGVIVSGILPNMNMMDKLDQMGVTVAADDLLNCGRRLLNKGLKKLGAGEPEISNPEKQPYQDILETDNPKYFEDLLANKYLDLPPCPTRVSSHLQRLEHLLSLLDISGARGIIFSLVKFCEPELFDLPILQKELQARNIPSVVIESELHQNLDGQLNTRLDAFLEML